MKDTSKERRVSIWIKITDNVHVNLDLENNYYVLGAKFEELQKLKQSSIC